MLIEFLVLLCILLACTRVNIQHERSMTTLKNLESNGTLRNKVENIYENENEEPPATNRFRNNNNNDSYTISRSFRQNYHVNDPRPNIYKP